MGSNQQMPFVLFNTSLFEENNSVYDPNMINTNLLDVNFQNKFTFSTEQYFEGKMFEQNYTNYENIPSLENFNDKKESVNESNKEYENKNNQNISSNVNESENIGMDINNTIQDNQNIENKNKNANDKDEIFKPPQNINKNKEGEKIKRKSRFDQ